MLIKGNFYLFQAQGERVIKKGLFAISSPQIDLFRYFFPLAIA